MSKIERGYFGIGILQPKTSENVGTLWRTAYQLGAAFIYTIGGRCANQPSDTTSTYRHIPLYTYQTFEQFKELMPYSCPLIGIEFGGVALATVVHPESAVYLLGSEDHGISPDVQEKCDYIVQLAAVRQLSFNVAIAGALVMYDRLNKRSE